MMWDFSFRLGRKGAICQSMNITVMPAAQISKSWSSDQIRMSSATNAARKKLASSCRASVWANLRVSHPQALRAARVAVAVLPPPAPDANDAEQVDTRHHLT